MFSTGWLARFWFLIGGHWKRTYINFGQHTFSQGQSSHVEDFPEEINKVWFFAEQKGTDPGEFDMISTDVSGNRVTFFADVQSNSCKVKWFVQG